VTFYFMAAMLSVALFIASLALQVAGHADLMRTQGTQPAKHGQVAIDSHGELDVATGSGSLIRSQKRLPAAIDQHGHFELIQVSDDDNTLDDKDELIHPGLGQRRLHHVSTERPKSLIMQDAAAAEGTPIRSCRHAAFDDTANPNRMKLGTYCADGTDYTADANGRVAIPHELANCASWTTNGEHVWTWTDLQHPRANTGGFYGMMEECPVVKSCKHATYQDNANPNRMKYGGAYCVDTTPNTNDANGNTISQTELDSCRVWTIGGGGFTPSRDLCGGAVENDDAKCNTYVCPESFFLRRNAPDIKCAGDVCTDELDRGRCCKALTREVEGKWCKNSQALNWGLHWTLEECVAWALNAGADFFVYGHEDGDQAQKCLWQRSEAQVDCTGEDCCHCTNGKSGEGCTWEAWDFDFYKLA